MKNLLKFRSDYRFKIVQFTDIHWHNGEAPDKQSAALMKQIMEAESPDLVVLTGDILAGGGCDDAADSLLQLSRLLNREAFHGQRFWATTMTKATPIAISSWRSCRRAPITCTTRTCRGPWVWNYIYPSRVLREV